MERIMKYINRVYRASIIDRAEAFEDEDLFGTQLSYILQVVRNPGLSQDALAKSLFVNKSSVTRQLNSLEKAGYVRRETDEEDRRAKKIYPTERALAIYPEIMAYLESWNDELTGDLSPEEQTQLLYWVRYLARKATSMQTQHALERQENTSC
jgi:MarR family transcriptional regulator for hemolysin